MVMIKYSIEKIGGSVVGYDSSRQIAFISYNGMEVGYQVDRVVQIADDNGDLVSRAIGNIDSWYKFMSSMGYTGTPESLLHNPNDEFNSMNEAAYAWALRYNKQSMTCINNENEIGYEMGSYIYLNRDKGTYFFGYPASDYKKDGMTFGPMNKAVAMIHSHDTDDPGAYDEQFSDADIRNFTGIHKYVVTPSGRLIYREPNAWIDGIHEAFPGYVIVGLGTGIYSGVYIDG